MSGEPAFSAAQSRRSTATRAGFVLGEGGFGLWLEQATVGSRAATARKSSAWPPPARRCG